MKKPKFTTSAAITAAVIVGIATAGITASTYAASTPGGNTDMHQKLITALAQRFNLKEADVQQFFEDQHTQMEANHEQAMKDRLSQAVQNKILTQAQADAITAKQAEMKTFMESLKGKTPEERRTALQTQMDSFKKWATDNNISKEFMPFEEPRMEGGRPDFERHEFGPHQRSGNNAPWSKHKQ